MTLALVAAAVIGAIWFGYPLVIGALAALRRPAPPPPPATLPTVTVVIATRDAPELVRRRVRDALAAEYPPEKLNAVVGLDAGGSATQPDDLAEFGGRVIAVPGDEPGGKSSTLNAAVRAATGEVLVFTDAGQTFEPGAIRRLVAALAAPRVGAASGRLEIAASGGPSLAERYWRFERWIRRAEAAVHSTVGVTGAIYAMSRDRWAPLPPGLILDDLYVPMRLVLAGYRIAFVDDARATDARRFDTQQEFKRKARTLTGVLQLCAWLPGVLVPFRNPVWLQFVFHKLLRLLTPYLLVLFLAGTVWAAVSLLSATALALLVGAGLVLLGALLITPRIGRRLRSAAVQGVALQGAVVVAAYNGLRGRWDVWHR